ncbi:hypothetical protein T05_9532 [Trichinella murrelli]|uniref:Uncharacterized protein n=1 Tax=Trichinella murrelli TaxID=144512 RepID=A0A0V0UHD8_9BILA|nr:hypothetical protein T05_9532 [Trichinella murrelli]
MCCLYIACTTTLRMHTIIKYVMCSSLCDVLRRWLEFIQRVRHTDTMAGGASPLEEIKCV